MACGCSSTSGCKPTGCNSNGGCSTGGCNRKNTYDWLSDLDIPDPSSYDVVEISFKHGSRKAFYRCPANLHLHTGDMVAVESNTGYDVGRITLSGELVRLQMRKKRATEKHVIYNVLRRANERDLERLSEARELEMPTLVRARAIAASLGLDMKIGDVEFQGDKRKVTFFYTAEGRIDFRELIRHYAGEFRSKIEMRQIGARQEAGMIGGLGPCGRELCCSTWLTDFKSVTTHAARYQNLAINQAKLSGQCGRLKCCLNYELDTYLEAIGEFPQDVDRLMTKEGRINLIKTDIFKGLMYYAYDRDQGRGKIYALDKEKVKTFVEMNKRGEHPEGLAAEAVIFNTQEDEHSFDDQVTGIVELPPDKKRSKNRRNKPSAQGKRPPSSGQRPGNTPGGGQPPSGPGGSSNKSKNRRRPPRDHGPRPA